MVALDKVAFPFKKFPNEIEVVASDVVPVFAKVPVVVE